MRNLPINNQLFIDNRAKFVAQMKPNAIAIFVSNDVFPKNADQFHLFRQNSELYYLTGIAQEETVLVLYPDCPIESRREVLFTRQTNEHIAIWEGHKYTKKEAAQISGINTVLWNDEFENAFRPLMNYANICYLNLNDNDRSNLVIQNKEHRFANQLTQNYPLHQYERASNILKTIRSKKHPIEVQLMQTACNITNQAFQKTLKIIKPNLMEYEIEAAFAQHFIANRSEGFAYNPIIASGKNACILHYIENNQSCLDGDLILMDVGADYAYYAADMTRCVPVNGKFTDRQRTIYNAVLKVMQQAIKELLHVGKSLNEYNQQSGIMMEEALIEIGLLNYQDVKKQDPNNPLYKRYFMHGTGHFLGIDVHDIGYRYGKFEAGMVITCEPGIYIAEENIGIRLENNILITENGNFDLMADIPIQAEHIEDLMNA